MEKLKDFLPPIDKCPLISFNMRLFSYLFCILIGFITTAMSIGQLFLYNAPHYRTFNLWYTLSNIIWLISTFILFEPRENYRKMLSDELYTKSIILTGLILLSLLTGFFVPSKEINIFFSFLQFCSVLNYAYSYSSLNDKIQTNAENPKNIVLNDLQKTN